MLRYLAELFARHVIFHDQNGRNQHDDSTARLKCVQPLPDNDDGQDYAEHRNQVYPSRHKVESQYLQHIEDHQEAVTEYSESQRPFTHPTATNEKCEIDDPKSIIPAQPPRTPYQ